MNIDLGRPPEGATHKYSEPTTSPWRDLSGPTWKWWSPEDGWRDSQSNTLRFFKRNSHRLTAVAHLAWNGEGLPPVGTVCESMWNESRDEWFKAEVFGVNEHGQPIFRWEEGVKKYEYQASPLTGHRGNPYFRPIRTPEQISADDRAAAVEEMWATYWKPEPQTAKEALGLLWDAGWRKQVKP